GVYLLKSRAFSHRLCSEETDGVSNSKLAEYFAVGAKLYGIFLIVGTIPKFLTLLANFLFVVNRGFPEADIVTAATGLRTNFVPDLAMIIFGILLLFKSETVTLWAFPSGNEDDTEGS